MAEAERSVAVRLRAVGVREFAADFGRAGKSVQDFATQAGRTSGSAAASTKQLGTAARQVSTDVDKASAATKNFGDAAGKASEGVGKVKASTKDAGVAAQQLGAGMAVAGAAIAAGLGLAVKAFADFDKEMSNVAAVSDATTGELQQLTDAALAAGAATKFSASDAAEAEAELAKAGISVKDILGGALTGALDLAAAGNLNLADAASYAANAMNIFDLKGSDVGHVADLLAASASKADGEVSDFGAALSQSGLVAAQVGLSLEDTSGVLAAFADNALKGSDGGTSLKTMLQRLVPQSDAAAQAMKDIGFSAYDAQGAFVGIDKVAEQLQVGLSGLTQKQRDSTLATIFGSDAVRAANVLYKIGGQGVRDYTTAVNDQGAAARIAAKQMDNLAGDMENLSGSIETALIKGGSGANDALRGLAQAATSAVNAFGDLPDEVQSGVVELAALASGALLLGGGLITVVPKLVATKEALDAIAASSPRAATGLGLVAKAGALLAAAAIASEIDSVAAASRVAQPPIEGLAKGLQEIGQGADASKDFGSLFARGMGPFERTFENASDALDDFGSNAKLALDANLFEGFFGRSGTAAATFKERIGQIDAALVQLVQNGRADEAAKAVGRLEASAQGAGLAAGRITQELSGYRSAVEGAAVANGEYADKTGEIGTAADGATGSTRLLGDEIKDAKDAAKDAKAAYDQLTKSIKDYGSALDADLAAESAFESSLDTAAERVQKRAEIQSQIAKLQKADAKGNAAEIARLKEQLSDYAATLDLGTKAGRDNVASLRDIAQNAKDVAVANFENGASVGEVADQMDKARAKFIEQAKQYGATSEQAKYLADNLGLTRENVEKLAAAPPADVRVDADVTAALAALNDTSKLLDATDGRVATATVTADTAPAYTAIADTGALLDATDARTATATISADAAKALTDASTFDQLMSQIDGQTAKATIQVAYERVGPSLEAITGLADGSLGFKGFAGGGYLSGPGTKTSDSFVIAASDGEFMQPARAVDYYGRQFMEDVRHLRIPRFADGGFIAPRFVSDAMVARATTTNFNSGGNVTNDRRINIERVVAADVNAIEREADRRRRLDSLGTRRAH